MKNLIIYLLIAVTLSACGSIRKVFKLHESESASIQTRTSTDSIAVRVDRTTTTIRKTADTVVTTPERTVTQTTKLNQDSLIKGINAIQSDLVDVKLTLDVQTGILTAVATVKPQTLPVRMDVEQTVRNDIQEGIRRVQENQTNANSKWSSSEVQRDPDYGFMWPLVIGLLLVVGLVWWLRKR
ncbi:hypothetical protein [Pedobacter faecalis]|uniref:hypothetical protein n=1 Tax=Pedobacter faecalis TaxID=3041495 RepID=UPI002550318C|nr:hypothetical protein [Pedobacter sp. ELA7]